MSESVNSDTSIQQIADLKVENGIVHINNKATLEQIMTNYQKKDGYPLEFEKKIISMQNEGFRPLTPIFDNYTEEQTALFVKRKLERNKKRSLQFGLYNHNASTEDENAEQEPVRLDDDLIFDPAFAAILNEDREIVVENKLYKYTEMGIFKVDENEKNILDTYLDSLSVAERIALIPADISNTQSNPTCTPVGGAVNTISQDIDLIHVPQLPPCIPQWTSNPSISNNTPTPSNPTYAPLSNFTKSTLSICAGNESSLWDKIFGPTKTCSYFMNDGKCVITQFWNQNFYFYSSVGSKVNFEKRKCAHFLWMSTCWWEKSYPTRLELGVNAVKYTYNFNVPMFNAQQFGYSTTFFSFNGTNYNQYGQVIPTIPTGKGNFIFDTTSDKSLFNIVVLGYQVTNANLNAAIDLLAKSLVDQMPNSSAKNEIITKMQNNTIKYNVVNAIPFSNKVTLITTNVEWASNNHRLTRYFDYNFLFSWNSNMSGWGDYLAGLTGATRYTDVEADIYGVALNNGQWGGRRLIFK